ncbi:hypothetical protein PDK35_10375 [Bacillus cereus group sp. TH153LC]|uniref:hypothetical protein n=1 Tax=Bacillus cereus group sp. TH153LC TaxID=3018059 RepID=UPI0022E2A494|nr:hypothetical protein [Bacillus cereus group sp. TH153LC]MDA1660369.1 hypothetical protein [Bacillus cereus group sp. TH153LC]
MKTEMKIEGKITLHEAVGMLQKRYDEGTLFENITEAQKDELLKNYKELSELGDIFDLDHLAVKYIKDSVWIGDKNRFYSLKQLRNKFERELQASDAEYKDERQAVELHKEAISIWKELVQKSDEDFSEVLEKAVETRDVALFYLEYMKLRAYYVSQLYDTFASKIKRISDLAQHALAKRAMEHYELFKTAKQPKMKYLEDMKLYYDKEHNELIYTFYFHVPYRRWVVTESATCNATIKIVK